jgi:hypothetical protein
MFEDSNLKSNASHIIQSYCLHTEFHLTNRHGSCVSFTNTYSTANILLLYVPTTTRVLLCIVSAASSATVSHVCATDVPLLHKVQHLGVFQ